MERIGEFWFVSIECLTPNSGHIAATALLACEVSKRKIILVNVKLVWTDNNDPIISVSQSDAICFEDDRRSVTALEWIELDGKQVSSQQLAFGFNSKKGSQSSCIANQGEFAYGGNKGLEIGRVFCPLTYHPNSPQRHRLT